MYFTHIVLVTFDNLQNTENTDVYKDNYQIDTLEHFVSYLNVIRTELICFFRFLNSIQRNERIYFLPYGEKNILIKSVESELGPNQHFGIGVTEYMKAIQKLLYKEGYKYVTGVYKYCFDTNIKLNLAHSCSHNEHDIYYYLVRKNLLDIYKLFNRYYGFL